MGTKFIERHLQSSSFRETMGFFISLILAIVIIIFFLIFFRPPRATENPGEFMGETMQLPSIGRIVIVVPATDDTVLKSNGATELPAIVVRTWPGEQHSVNVQVFTDGVDVQWRHLVPYDKDGAPGTWHWPARL